MLRKIAERLALAAVIVICCTLLWLLQTPAVGCQNKTVQDVGGCNSQGFCSVRFTDDTFGYEILPVRGNTYTVCPDSKDADNGN